MAQVPRAIPENYHSLTPDLIVNDGERAIEFYIKAFGATELYRMNRPDGRLAHAELKIGDSILMLSEECMPHPGHDLSCPRSPSSLKGTTTTLYFYVHDVDPVFKQARDAGGEPMLEPVDMFWGDRVGQIRDPFGHSWTIATHKEDLEPREIENRARQFYASCA